MHSEIFQQSLSVVIEGWRYGRRVIANMWLCRSHDPGQAHKALMGGCRAVDYYKSLRLSRSEVVTALRKLENLVPADLLR